MKNTEKQIIIYNDDVIEYIANNKDYIINQLKDNDEKISDETIMQAAAYLINNDEYLYLRDLIKYFDEGNKNKIIVEGDLGLWYGRRKIKAAFNDLFTAFYKCVEDSNKVYFDNKNTTLKLEAAHHDGVNKYKFYKIVNGKKYAIKYKELLNL